MLMLYADGTATVQNSAPNGYCVGSGPTPVAGLNHGDGCWAKTAPGVPVVSPIHTTNRTLSATRVEMNARQTDCPGSSTAAWTRSEEHTSDLQSRFGIS